jgi:hypothetical protein
MLMDLKTSMVLKTSLREARRADDVLQALQLVRAERLVLCGKTAATAVHRLGKVGNYGSLRQSGTLLWLLDQAGEHSDTMDNKGVASTAWGLAKFGLPREHPLWRAIMWQAQMIDLNAFAIANLTWALATAGVPMDTALVDTVVRDALASRQNFTPQAIANFLWALATGGVSMDADLVEGMSDEACLKSGKMKAVDAAQILWALATARAPLNPALVEAMGTVVMKSDNLRPHDVVQVLWALATAKVAPKGDVLAHLLSEAVKMSRDFTPQHISNLMWALSTFAIPQSASISTLVVAMSKQAVRKRRGFTPQAIANLLWAMANLGAPIDAALVEAMSTEAMAKTADMKPVDSAQILWAFAIADVAPDAELVYSLLRPLLIDALDDRAVVQLHQFFIWNSISPNALDVDAYSALAGECKRRFIDYSTLPANIQTSMFEGSVKNALHRMRVPVSEDKVLFDCGMCVDFRLAGRLSQVVLEADGPSHYLHELGPRPPKPLLNPSTRFKHRVLQKLGWKVLPIPYYEWSRLGTSSDDQAKYLLCLLASVLKT